MIALAWEGDWPVSQFFGEHPQNYAWAGLAGHNGLDVATPAGTAVRAAWASDLVERGHDDGGYGRYVKLRHANGHDLLYGHLSGWADVPDGYHFAAGEVVGWSGNTGWSTGPHLHLGFRPDHRYRGGGYLGYVDPLPLILGLL